MTYGIRLLHGHWSSARQSVKLLRVTSSLCATYLGHTDIAHTYWYLEATPELMTGIAAATEAFITEENL